MADKFDRILGGTLIMAVIGALLSIAAYGSFIGVRTALPMIAGSWAHHNSVHADEPDTFAGSEEYREKSFKLVCGAYFRASYPYRKIAMREDAWCENALYVDRM